MLYWAMASHYKLLFRGAIHADQHAAVVRPRLQAMLKASDAQMDVMFSGKPVTIKKSVDEATAEKYLDAFFKAGAKLELVEAAAPASEPAAAPAPASTPAPKPAAVSNNAKPAVQEAQAETVSAETVSGAFQLADVGADLVAASERKAPVESTVATDHLSLANPGTRLGEEANASDAETTAVDTSHLQLDQPGVRLGVPEPEATDIERLLNFDFELGEVGEVLVESSPQVEPELPDLSHLQLESLPADEADSAQELS